MSGLPIEWLIGLDERRDAYERLIEEAGSLAAAAHRLARARCLVWEVPTQVPTRSELRAAARQIARRVGLAIPDGSYLAHECEAQGLLVI